MDRNLEVQGRCFQTNQDLRDKLVRYTQPLQSLSLALKSPFELNRSIDLVLDWEKNQNREILIVFIPHYLLGITPSEIQEYVYVTLSVQLEINLFNKVIPWSKI